MLEPEILGVGWDALAYEALDHSGENAALADFLAAKLGFRRGKLVDLGAGPGDIPVAICRRLKAVRVTAVERASAMLLLASAKIARSGFAGRIALLRADAKNTKLPDGSFDLVFCNNLIHHIPEPDLIFREIARLCRSGGGLFLKDLRRPGTPGELKALVNKGARADTPRQKGLLRDSLHAALRIEEVRAYARRAGLTGFTLRAVGDRHWQLHRPAACKLRKRAVRR